VARQDLTPGTRDAADGWAGVRAALPLLPGVAAFALVYGVLARQAGLSLGATATMSVLVFAGAAQFTAISMWGQASPVLIVLTAFIINLRHLLMGASLAPHLRREPSGWKALLAFGMADETYALAISRYLAGAGSRLYFLGVNLILYATWVVAGLAGGVLGGQAPDPGPWGVGLVFPLTFLGLLVPLLADRVTVVVAATSALVTVITAPWLPGKGNILLAILVGGAVGAAWEARWSTQ
jgi:4-azaleucine resistance transporter AzlC